MVAGTFRDSRVEGAYESAASEAFDGCASHRQYCLNVLSRYGAAPNEVLTPIYESDKDRFTAWLADSLLYAMAELTRTRGTDWCVVLRCWGQAREYAGRIGGFPEAGLADALVWLQNELERHMSEPTPSIVDRGM